MKLPSIGEKNKFFRRTIWGKTSNVGYYNHNQREWMYKSGMASADVGQILSIDNMGADDWIEVNVSNKEDILVGDTVILTYISTHDSLHPERHDYLHKKYKVLQSQVVKHPEMGHYKGESPWFKCVLILAEGVHTQLRCEYVQLQRIEREHVANNKDLRVPVRYGSLDIINNKLREITRQRAPIKGDITTAQKGDTVMFIGRPGLGKSTSFIEGSQYILRSNYRSSGYHTSEDENGKHIAGTISVEKDSAGKSNGWAAAFFRIVKRGERHEEPVPF